ncbi:MAG: Ig-like domain-containing protein, partial [Cognaticolwellia sp.]
LNADGSYTFTPTADYNGPVPVITYTVLDGAGDTDISTLTIAITPSSDLTDGDESVTIAEDTPVSGDVLDNASTADGPLSITSFTVGGNTYNAGDTVNLAEGELTLNADGSYTFTPTADYNGPVPVITYTVLDGAGDTTTSSLTIAVTPVPAAEDDNFNIDEGESVSGNVITHNDGDGISDSDAGDGSTLVVTQVNGVDLVFGADGFAVVAVDGGILTINAAGNFTYVNSDGFVLGADFPSFEYTLSDGDETDTATVTISINDSAPEAVDDNNYITYKDENGLSIARGVRGSIITRGSSGDREDSSPDGTIILTQIEYAGQAYVFDASNTVYSIDTGFGTLEIYNTGLYYFDLDAGIDISTIPDSLQFVYTIQDGDSANAETDQATLTISFTHDDGTNTSSVEPSISDSDLIDLSYNEQSTDVVMNDQHIDIGESYDLSELIVDSESIDDSVLFNELSESDVVTEGQDDITPIDHDSLTLKSTEQGEVTAEHQTIITNDLLTDGATLVNDGSTEIVPPQIELDTTDHI